MGSARTQWALDTISGSLWHTYIAWYAGSGILSQTIFLLLGPGEKEPKSKTKQAEGFISTQPRVAEGGVLNSVVFSATHLLRLRAWIEHICIWVAALITAINSSYHIQVFNYQGLTSYRFLLDFFLPSSVALHHAFRLDGNGTLERAHLWTSGFISAIQSKQN